MDNCFFHHVASRDGPVLALAWDNGQGKEAIALLSILVSQAQDPSPGKRAPNSNLQMEKVLVWGGGVSSKYRTPLGGTRQPLSCSVTQTQLLQLVGTNGCQGRKRQETGLNCMRFDRST